MNKIVNVESDFCASMRQTISLCIQSCVNKTKYFHLPQKLAKRKRFYPSNVHFMCIILNIPRDMRNDFHNSDAYLFAVYFW